MLLRKVKMQLSIKLNTFLNKSRILRTLSVFVFLLHYNNNAMAYKTSPPTITGIFNVETEFCLVNSTVETISIRNVWSIDNADWTGKFQPLGLLNQTVMPFSAECWPLTLVRRVLSYNQFNIEIQTASGQISWAVKQYDAVGEINKKYDLLKNETNYYILQKAGDNNGYATNVFVLEDQVNIQEDYLSNWMKRIPDNYTLKDVQLIGTHDAGVNIQDGVSCNAPSALAVAQEWGITKQLNHGIRYFDIRLEKGNDNRHYPYHKTWSLGCSSQKSFEQSLNEIINFIKLHSSETVILKISHTSSPSDSVIKMLDTFTNTTDTGRYFYKSNIENFNWVDKKISDVRGKIVLLLDCEYMDYLNPQKGYFSFSTSKEKNCSPDDATKIIYDNYSNTKAFDDMYRDQLNKLNQHGKDKNQLFLLSWTLTGGDIIAHTPRPAAYLARLSKEQFGKLLPVPNIIYYDFEDPGINKILIANYERNLPQSDFIN